MSEAGDDAPDTPPTAEPDDRLDSWKEIAAYLRRGVSTVQRWEKEEGLPTHRLQHAKQGSVYAFKSELDAWMRARRQPRPETSGSPVDSEPEDAREESEPAVASEAPETAVETPHTPAPTP